MRESRKRDQKPVRASHLGSVVLGAIAGMTVIVVVASAAATIFPEVFQLRDVRVETEAPEVATLPPEKEDDFVISHETEAAETAAAETTAEESSEADLAAEAQKAAEEVAKEAATRAGVTEAVGPASETTGTREASKETKAEGPAGPGAETDSPGAREKKEAAKEEKKENGKATENVTPGSGKTEENPGGGNIAGPGAVG
ncbi:MAG: hypothetical protein K5760_02225 [Clostridium sp.]|nr:hypothetical protein [Clostridium sp.]